MTLSIGGYGSVVYFDVHKKSIKAFSRVRDIMAKELGGELCA